MTNNQIERVERCLIDILERVALSKHLSVDGGSCGGGRVGLGRYPQV